MVSGGLAFELDCKHPDDQLVLGGDPGIIWLLADIRHPLVVAVTDDGLTARGDVPSTDVSADALFAYEMLGSGAPRWPHQLSWWRRFRQRRMRPESLRRAS
jgi:hypothetical protein